MRNSCGCSLVDGWPCVPALLSVDNIVLGGWLTLWTWRHEIILCQAMCSRDRDKEGVTLLWNLPRALQAALPVLSDMYTHSFPSYSAFLRNLNHPSCSFIKTLPIPFIILFVFSQVYKSINNLWLLPIWIFPGPVSWASMSNFSLSYESTWRLGLKSWSWSNQYFFINMTISTCKGLLIVKVILTGLHYNGISGLLLFVL